MTLTVHLHPLASFCQKVLIALYENDTPFAPLLVDLGEEGSAAAFKKLWPLGKMPVLRDDAKDRTIPESSIIIEYLALYYPGRTPLLPADADLALRTRLADRFYDLHVHEPMQKIVVDRLRPPGQNDVFGVELARKQLQTAYGVIDRDMATRTWATGDQFSLADCAAAPALYFADKVAPFDAYPNVAGYFGRLMQRPSVARTVQEAQPYLKYFPE